VTLVIITLTLFSVSLNIKEQAGEMMAVPKAKPLGELLESNHKKQKQLENQVNKLDKPLAETQAKLMEIKNSLDLEPKVEAIKEVREKRDTESELNETCTKTSVEELAQAEEEKQMNLLDNLAQPPENNPELPGENKEANSLHEISPTVVKPVNKLLVDAIKEPSVDTKPSEIGPEPVVAGDQESSYIKPEEVKLDNTEPLVSEDKQVKSLYHLTPPEVKLSNPELSAGESKEGILLGKPMSRDLRSVKDDEEQ
jgi:phosphoribosyl-dephospho-CoA transferase